MAKKTNRAVLFSMFCSALFTTLTSTSSYADETEQLSIKVMSDANVFAKLDDEVPAVVNYFTRNSEEAIIAFYEEQYGKAITSDRKRGRLEKSFIQDDYNIKIIISEQSKQRQVDVLVTK